MTEINQTVSSLRFSKLAGMALLGLIIMLFMSANAQSLSIDPVLNEKIESGAGDAQVRAILTFAEQPPADVVGTVASHLKITHQFQQLPMLVVHGYPSQIELLYDLPGLISVESDRQLEYYTREGVPIAGGSRQRDFFKYSGSGIGVAILDSGIDGSHTDVRYPQRTIQNVKIECVDPSCESYVYVEGVENTDTSSGHGTHVAGIAAGDGSSRSDRWFAGMAPGANLVGIGVGDTIFIIEALAGFDYILEHKNKYNIRVVNASWGSTGEYDENNAVNQATKILHDRGVTVVFAAGNSGPGENTLNPYSIAPWVIGVGAAAKDGKTLADFSSRGVPGDALKHPTLTAPGVAIVSAKSSTPVVTGASVDVNSSYAMLSGTSMAAPFVSGTIAEMLQGNPGLSPDDIKAKLASSAVAMPGYEAYKVGAGYLAADRAVASATGRSMPLDGSFKVTAVSPTPGATGVARDTQIMLTFSQPLDTSSINSGNIFLLDSGGAAVSVNVSLAGSQQVKIAPAKQLASNRAYSVVVTGGVKNVSGSYPLASFVSTFTTDRCGILCLNLGI